MWRWRPRPAVVLAALLLIAGTVLVRVFGFHAIDLSHLAAVRRSVEAYGTLGPVIFVGGYVFAEVLFVPALPLTLLGGLAFGPIWGAVYVAIAATASAGAAFLIGRYLLRGLVDAWVAANPRLRRIDAAVARHGWRILILTRLVPLFPFNLQNYAYGLTRIGFWTYLALSAVGILPATVAYTFAAGALAEDGASLHRTLTYLAVAAVLIIALSLAPAWFRSRRDGMFFGSAA